MSVAEFVPYSHRAPATTDLRKLRAELKAVRAAHDRRSAEAAEAFEALFRAAAKQGHPLDSLRRHKTDEIERFFSLTIPGPDGHMYWDGARNKFTRNDGKVRVPRRWWWGHRAGAEPNPYEDVVPVCGDLACINPEHCQAGRDLRRRKFTDEQMLGAIKVAALRLGRPPTCSEWDVLGLSPSENVFRLRFGSWPDVIRAAGLTYMSPAGGVGATPEECLGSLRHFHKIAGVWPTSKTIRTRARELREAGFPSTAVTIARHHGTWAEALRRAKESV